MRVCWLPGSSYSGCDVGVLRDAQGPIDVLDAHTSCEGNYGNISGLIRCVRVFSVTGGAKSVIVFMCIRFDTRAFLRRFVLVCLIASRPLCASLGGACISQERACVRVRLKCMCVQERMALWSSSHLNVLHEVLFSTHNWVSSAIQWSCIETR